MIPSTEVLWRLKCALKRAENALVSSIAITNVERLPSGFKHTRWCIGRGKTESDAIIGKLFEMSLGHYITDVKTPYFLPGQRCALQFILVESDDGKTNIDESVIEAVGKLKWVNNE